PPPPGRDADSEATVRIVDGGWRGDYPDDGGRAFFSVLPCPRGLPPMTPTAYNDETGASPQSTASGGERGGRYAPAVAAVAVAFIVGIASRGVPVWTELSDGAAERARAMEGVLRVGLVGLAVALAATLLIHHLVIARRPGAPPLRT